MNIYQKSKPIIDLLERLYMKARLSMPYIIPSKKIAVFFSPKSAGTSIRAFLFELENGFPFINYKVQGKSCTPNTLVKNNRFRIVNHTAIKDYARYAVIRDPVRRFLSGYSNRVVYYSELSEKLAGPALREKKLPPDPDLDSFINNFEAYKKCSESIDRHFSPQERFLGGSKGYYSRIFQVENITDFIDTLNNEFGTSAAMPRLQDGGPKIEFDTLSESTQASLVKRVAGSAIFDWAPDYKDRYKKYFS